MFAVSVSNDASSSLYRLLLLKHLLVLLYMQVLVHELVLLFAGTDARAGAVFTGADTRTGAVSLWCADAEA